MDPHTPQRSSGAATPISPAKFVFTPEFFLNKTPGPISPKPLSTVSLDPLRSPSHILNQPSPSIDGADEPAGARLLRMLEASRSTSAATSAGSNGPATSSGETSESTTSVEKSVGTPQSSAPKRRRKRNKGGEYAVQTQPEKNKADEISKQIRVPTTVSGTVVGYGGSTIKEIQARTGCVISSSGRNGNDNDDNDDDDEVRIFTLKGTSEAVADACRLIADTIAKATTKSAGRNNTTYSSANTAAADGDSASSQAKALAKKKKKRVKGKNNKSGEPSPPAPGIVVPVPLPKNGANVTSVPSVLAPAPAGIKFAGSSYTVGPDVGLLPMPVKAGGSA